VPLSECLGLESRRRTLARVLAAQYSQYPREAGSLGRRHVDVTIAHVPVIPQPSPAASASRIIVDSICGYRTPGRIASPTHSGNRSPSSARC
jgi:hypothetical protein